MANSNQLFDAINALFTNKNYINSLTKEFANQNIFMINRRIAINYPLQAQVFNLQKINNYDVLKAWSDFLYNNGTIPSWIYIKGAKKSKDNKNTVNSTAISPALIKKYADHYHLSIKDINDALKFDTDNAIAELQYFENLMKEYVKINNERNTDDC